MNKFIIFSIIGLCAVTIGIIMVLIDDNNHLHNEKASEYISNAQGTEFLKVPSAFDAINDLDLSHCLLKFHASDIEGFIVRLNDQSCYSYEIHYDSRECNLSDLIDQNVVNERQWFLVAACLKSINNYALIQPYIEHHPLSNHPTNDWNERMTDLLKKSCVVVEDKMKTDVLSCTYYPYYGTLTGG